MIIYQLKLKRYKCNVICSVGLLNITSFKDWVAKFSILSSGDAAAAGHERQKKDVTLTEEGGGKLGVERDDNKSAPYSQ